MSDVPCRLCGAGQWMQFSSITFGVWKENDDELLRDSKRYPLGECQQCGHVQVTCDYRAELFSTLYFHSAQEAVMWHEALVGSDIPYLNMVEFASSDKAPKLVVDFGCGEGKLLSVINSSYKNSKLIGIDFNDRFVLKNADYVSHDLNNLSDLPSNSWPSGIDLATASHVLEHVVEPVEFLTHIKSHLSQDGNIFIEVPDFSHQHDSTLIGKSNLVNLQHIHYFTADSLTYAAEQAGLEVIKLKHVTTGYIPRLQALFKRPAGQSSHLTKYPKFNGINAVRHYQAICRDRRQHFVLALLQQIERDKMAGIWGLGADFYELLNESTELIQAIEAGTLVLFDYAHKGKQFLSHTILCSSDIPKQKFKVFICPMLVETTIRMREVSQYWQNVVEFNDSEFMVPSYEQQKCQVCKDKKWCQLDTLVSGIWDKTQQELNRQELILPIGECLFCGHVQMMTVYDEQIFNKLYFSDVREPSMFIEAIGSELSPYQQMINFFKPYLLEGGNIVDFGCGAGNIFSEMKKQVLPKMAMTGVDFNPVIDDPNIGSLPWDLNSTDEMPKQYWPNGIDLAISTHVLEHVVDPVLFLKTIQKQLSDTGKVFIEVPDCSPNTDLTNLAFTNVVHAQHIHYFSLSTLALIAQQAGFRIIASKQVMTRTTPRVLLILEQAEVKTVSQKVQENASNVVCRQFKETKIQHKSLAKSILETIKAKGKAGLWGVGGDTYALLNNHPELVKALADETLRLFDLELAGHTYLGATIHCSSLLPSTDMTVFMTPLFAPTRAKMHLISKAWESNVIDPYKSDSCRGGGF